MRIFVLIVFCLSSLKTSAQKSSKVGTNYNDIIICELPIPAEFPGGSKAWAKYLQKNTNSELSNKYITIPKGRNSAKSTVRICFVISKWGYVIDVERATNDTIKVHPKLVAEAIRVIKASPRWIAERFNSKRVASRMCQAITWQASLE